MIKLRIDPAKMKNIEANHLTLQNDVNKNIKLELKANDKFNKFYKFLSDELQDLLIGQPDRLAELVDLFETKKVTEKLSEKDKEELTQSVKRIFRYDTFCDRKKEKWDAYQLVLLIGCEVCPYCNRNLTTSFDFGKKYVRADLDHFYAKSSYPYLALSLYNLIPCCNVCNSRTKKTSDFSLKKNIHPYVEGFENKLLFTLKPQKNEGDEFIKLIHFSNTNSFDISFENNGLDKLEQSRAENNIDAFALKELYGFSKSYVLHLLEKYYKLDNSVLMGMLRKKGVTSFKDQYELLYGNYWDSSDFGKRPMSKLTRDIYLFCNPTKKKLLKK